MRKIRDVLRLRAGGMSKRKIAASLSIGITAAGDCIRRANRAGLSWPLPEDLSDATLERLVYPPPQATDLSAAPVGQQGPPARTAPPAVGHSASRAGPSY
jgi:hypothetical protein